MPGIRLRKTRWFALVVALAFLLGASAALARTLDQAQEDTSNCARAVDDFQDTAQSFTAGLSGDLDQVDFNLGPLATDAPAVAVQIRTVTTTAGGDVPNGTVLATETVAPVTAWNTVPLDPTVPVTAVRDRARRQWRRRVLVGKHHGRLRGGNPSANFLGIGWMAAVGCDQAFRTYAAAPAVRPTQAAVQEGRLEAVQEPVVQEPGPVRGLRKPPGRQARGQEAVGRSQKSRGPPLTSRRASTARSAQRRGRRVLARSR
jgi:hypothetical protein